MRAKGLLVLGLALCAAFSQAAITFSNIEATVTFDGTEEFDLTVHESDFGLDFTAGEMPIFVATENSDFSSAVVNISYDASVDGEDAINGLELIFSGWNFGDGSITYEENVFDSEDNLIATASGTLSDDTPFVQSDFLQFEGQTDFRVEKTFTLDLGQGENPSFASIGLIEQNAVPEPATMGALAIGALGLLARKRRK